MRIAHITATFPPYRAGTGTVCYHNARELARRGHDVHVFTAVNGGAPAREEMDGFTVQRLRPLVQVGNAPLLPGLLRALRGFDVMHLHYPFFGGEMATVAAYARRTPLVITYHQDVLLHGALGLAATVLRHTAGRMTLRSAARVLFTSADYGRASYVRPMLRGREQTISELANGVDVQRFRPPVDRAALRAQHGVADDERVVLLVASLDRAHYFKGVGVLLNALAQLPPSFRAFIVGDGDLRASYVQHAAKLGVTARVQFAGRVADDTLPQFYQMADVSVLPSTTMGEAFGLVLIESLACATPVIASDIPGVRTVVEHGSDGMLVPPRDSHALAKAIQAVTANEDQRRAMGERGRARVEAHYAWEQIGARLEALYYQVLNREPVPAHLYARARGE